MSRGIYVWLEKGRRRGLGGAVREGQRAANGGGSAQGSSHFRCRRLRLADRGARRLICVVRCRCVMYLLRARTDT
jgi:hypothetical protein